MRLISTAVIFLIYFAAFAQTADATEQLQDASRLLKEDNIEEAIPLYENIIAEGYHNEEVYYNLGTAYTNIGEPGKAVLYLKKALKSNPRDGEIKHNLEIARKTVDTEVIAIPEFFLLRYWRSFSNTLSSGIWAILGLFCLIAAAVAFYYWLFGTSIDQKKKSFYGLLTGLLLFLLSFAAGWSSYQAETTDKYAVIMQTSTLYEGPDDRSEVMIQLSPGVECTVLDQIGDYVKVKLRDQEIGWVSVENIEKV